MNGEPEESFEKLSYIRVLSSDENTDLALVITTEKDSEFRCSFTPKQASDIVAKLIYAARERLERQDGDQTAQEEIPLMPLPVHQLETKQGRHPREALIRLSVGQIQLLLAMDVDALANLCVWLVDHLRKDDQLPSSLQ